MNFKTRDADELMWRLSLVLLILLAIGQLWLGWERSPSSDDALFLSVPKNWVNGYGWATSYSEKIPFNPDFTGPTALLFPAALLIKLFGNQLWIAGVTGAFINLLLLTLCLQQIRAYWKQPGMAALFLVCGCIISKTDDFASLIGYYSGSLLFLLATLLAFNPGISTHRRALLLGLSCALAFLIKLLLVPAFILLLLIFIAMLILRNTTPLRHSYRFVLLASLPVLVIYGSWQLYRAHELSQYPQAYLTEYKQYAQDFFYYHGSGIGQWHDARDKLGYLLQNANKNLYFVEEALTEYHIKNPFLGEAPADEHHIVAWILIATLLASVVWLLIKIRRHISEQADWTLLALCLAILIYLGWFAIFSMAMSPGHFYFQNQWLLWLTLLAISQKSGSAKWGQFAAATAVIGYTVFMLHTPNRLNTFALVDHSDIKKPGSLLAASSHIQSNVFPAPLAGCGYSGYPRHLEYLLPDSQNFSDCLDLIEDHVQLIDGKYQWKKPLAFTLVYSLQSGGMSPATSMVTQQCGNNVIYRSNDVFIALCDFKDLQNINLDNLMVEIDKTHRWYKTRIKP